jgi:hypothetical protein
MGWHAAYEYRFGMPPLENAETIESQCGWKSLYLQAHFFRIEPGFRALGIKRGACLSSLQIDLGEKNFSNDDTRHFELQLPVGVQNLRAAIEETDLWGAMHEPAKLDCAFGGEDDVISTIAVYRADLGTVEIAQNPRVIGIRVGMSARELFAITGAACGIRVGTNLCGILFEIPGIPNVQFELDDGNRSELDKGESYGSAEWWEAHLDRPIHCIITEL